MQTYLIIDFDSTFVSVEALDELARIALRGTRNREAQVAKIAQITKAGMEGRIGFGESLARRLALFRPTRENLDELAGVLKKRVTPSVTDARQFFEENADNIYVMSGGFRECILPVVREFGIAEDHVLANTFIHDEAGTVTGCDPNNPLAHDGGKVKQLAKLALRGRVIMVGDGFSDYQTRADGVADEFVAFTENVERPGVCELADCVASNFAEVMQIVRLQDLARAS